LKKLTGNTDIENSLERLDKLTQDETRMASAELLIITHGVDNTVKSVEGKVEDVRSDVHGVGNKVEGRIHGDVQDVGSKVQDVDHKVQSIDRNVKRVSSVQGFDELDCSLSLRPPLLI
jgi:archaellum component FlaC